VAVSVREVLGDVPSTDVVEALLLLLCGVFDQIDTVSTDRVLEHVGRLAAEHAAAGGARGASR
jgi:hypothetical protein